MNIEEKIKKAMSLIPEEALYLLAEAYDENSESEDSEEIEFLQETIRFIHKNKN